MDNARCVIHETLEITARGMGKTSPQILAIFFGGGGEFGTFQSMQRELESTLLTL